MFISCADCYLLEPLRAASAETESNITRVGKYSLQSNAAFNVLKMNAVIRDSLVGRKKEPSWKKICFQLENYFFPTRNPVLGGYWHFNA